MKRILIIEDDAVIRQEIATLLASSGYEAFAIAEFSDVLSQVKQQNPHLILLDINLPGQDGFKLCAQIRSFSPVPIVFVTSRNSDMDELSGIMSGGDDYITKPYNVPILLARIAALLKRAYPSNAQDCICCGDVTLFLDASRVEYLGNTIELTKNEAKIFSYLMKRQGTIVPRAQLIDFLWDNQVYVDDNALSVNVTRLRAKLEQLGIKGLIQTKHRQGYMI